VLHVITRVARDPKTGHLAGGAFESTISSLATMDAPYR